MLLRYVTLLHLRCVLFSNQCETYIPVADTLVLKQRTVCGIIIKLELIHKYMPKI